MAKKYLLIIFLFVFLLNSAGPVFAQEIPSVNAPNSLDEAKSLGGKAIDESPGILRSLWSEFMVIWDKVWAWFKITFGWMGERIMSVLSKEVEKRRPEVEEEFKKEVREMKEDVPKTTKSLWERFRELF